LGGHGKNGTLECTEERCPDYNQMVTQNDGRSFQGGCGWDILETGCCFEDNDTKSYRCFRCEELLVLPHNATCASEALEEWGFDSAAEVPLAFRSFGEIIHCGANLNPEVLNTSSTNYDVNRVTTSNMFLCNVWEWEQGDYIDNAGLQNEVGVGTDFGLKSGRHVRVNHNNYQRDADPSMWVVGTEVQGEGIYECFNRGSCIAPDKCSCRDGYGGYDCATPLCRHEQATGEIAGCVNGVCVAKDECQCIQQESVLWQVHEESDQGRTGWNGTDCSMPMCIQGWFDPNCNVSAAPGNEGCYRCANGGICVAPDLCQCAEGWSGYDCKTPVCRADVTPLIREQLMTNDPKKIEVFINDPCGMVGFTTLKKEGPRGVCIAPNQCACNCQASYDKDLCRRIGGRYCQTPFHDPRFKQRNLLAPNEIFGTRNCYSGYEGFTNEDDLFSSCHLRIFEPTFLQRYTSAVIALGTLTGLVLLVFIVKLWIKLSRRKSSDKRNRQLERSESTNVGRNAFQYKMKRRKSD